MMPPTMPVNPQAIPEILRRSDRWLCWSWTWNKDKNGGAGGWDKPPLDARTGRNGSSTDAATWTSFDVAYRAHAKGNFSGVGFVLGNDPLRQVVFSGLDLDDCIRGGEVSADAMYLASFLNSYVEISPSGNGLKVFTLGSYPQRHRCTKKDLPFELYDGGRYFTVTGNHLAGTPNEVLERTPQLGQLYDQLFPSMKYSEPARNEVETACAALAALNPSRAVGYRDWLAVGMALHAVSASLLDKWDEWSQHCPDKYTAGVCEQKWQTFRKTGLGLGSLIFWAKEDGWRDGLPLSKRGATAPEVAGHPIAAATGSESGDDDAHMGDGLTEENGAGPWFLMLVLGRPARYLLRSPIWCNSPRLKDGFLVLTRDQLFCWKSIRKEALEQAGVYACPDRGKKAIWDGPSGPRLLKRLLRRCKEIKPSVDFDRVLAAAEYLLDLSQNCSILTEDKKPFESLRSMRKTEAGDVLFKLSSIASQAKRDCLSFSFEDLREAAERFGHEHFPQMGSKRIRAYRIKKADLELLEQELISSSSSSACATRATQL